MSLAERGSGWLIVVNVWSLPTINLKTAFCTAANEMAMAWNGWLLNHAVIFTTIKRGNKKFINKRSSINTQQKITLRVPIKYAVTEL